MTASTAEEQIHSLLNQLNPANPQLAGYTATASLMGSHPELAIFRKFQNVAAQDLLYRQAEVQQYVQLWMDQVIKDEGKDGNLRIYRYSFAELLDSVKHTNTERGQQRRIWLDLSQRLESFHEALFRFQKLCNLPSADSKHVDMLRLHLNSSAQGSRHLMASEGKIYQNACDPKAEQFITADLTSISNTGEEDLITKFVYGPLIDLWHKCYGIEHMENLQALRVGEGDVVEYPYKAYSNRRANLLVGLLYAILTTCLITLAVVLLNYIRSSLVRIILIVVCNLVFTVAMAFSVQGKPKDFFAVAAAYAAVLVVFANSPSTPNPSTSS